MEFICNEFGHFLAISNPGMAKTTAETSDSESCDDLPELLDLTDLTDWTDDEVTAF